MLGLSNTADYTNFEKCIHLKGSQLMKNLEDDKVSLVAQLSRVVILNHGDVLYTANSVADAVYVVIEGTIAISTSSDDAAKKMGDVTSEMREGDCFGEEVSFCCFTFVGFRLTYFALLGSPLSHQRKCTGLPRLLVARLFSRSQRRSS